MRLVTGLDNGVPYSFKVAAIDADGAGLRSRASTPVTPVVVVPQVTSISPTSSPRTGGTLVTITGNHLGAATRVRFGSVDAASFTVVSATKIEAVTPDLPVGDHVVRVTDPAGTSAASGPKLAARPLVAGAPSGVGATPAWAQITVTWTAPTVPGDSARTGYVVRAVPGVGPTVTASVGANATSVVVKGLVPGRAYKATVAAISAAGEGASAQSAAVSVPSPVLGPFASLEALVARQYRDFVGRTATGAETSAGATSIRGGTQPSEAFIAAMRLRPEWGGRRAAVIRLYSAYFLRTPDTAGLAYWADRLKAGTPLSKVSQSFAGSPEFKARYGNISNTEFVRRVYRNVLDREPDASGLTYWKGELDKGMTRGALMIGFSESGENKTRMGATVDVVLLHAAMLGRVPTGDELTDGLALLGTGTVADVARDLLTSTAYASRVA